MYFLPRLLHGTVFNKFVNMKIFVGIFLVVSIVKANSSRKTSTPPASTEAATTPTLSTTTAEATTTLQQRCNPPEGKTGRNRYAVLKRNCYSSREEPYIPVFYPLQKNVPYQTSPPAITCGAELSVRFYGEEVCISFTYKENKWGNRGPETIEEKCVQKCFTKSLTILEVKNRFIYSYPPVLRQRSDLVLILVPKHDGKQPKSEPCYPDKGKSGPAQVAVLKRLWCKIHSGSHTQKICATARYPLLKDVTFHTAETKQAHGNNVSALFYGREVCIAYIYEEYAHSRFYDKRTLTKSYCHKPCFEGKILNQPERFEAATDVYNPAVNSHSDYELILTSTSGKSGISSSMVNSLAALFSLFAMVILF